MSFYTALTGLNDLKLTSQQPLTTSQTLRLQVHKRSKAEFGDIFATSPFKCIIINWFGTILKGIKQQFTQGNVTFHLTHLI